VTAPGDDAYDERRFLLVLRDGSEVAASRAGSQALRDRII
jgi:hypothetical protein